MLDTISIKEMEINHAFLPPEKLKQKITTKNIPPPRKTQIIKAERERKKENIVMPSTERIWSKRNSNRLRIIFDNIY